MGAKFTAFVHDVLDYLSYHICQEKPSYHLVTDSLQIPKEDLSNLEKIFNAIRDGLGLLIVPFLLLNDKKFVIHIYETASVFISPNNPTQLNTVTTCEKMLMYIAQNQNKITEQRDKQVIKTVTLHDNDYDIPVNYWYTLKIDNTPNVNNTPNIDNTIKVYFFAHISVLQNYKGIVIAVDKRKDITILSTIKKSALDFYDQTLGLQNNPLNLNKKMDFI